MTSTAMDVSTTMDAAASSASLSSLLASASSVLAQASSASASAASVMASATGGATAATQRPASYKVRRTWDRERQAETVFRDSSAQ